MNRIISTEQQRTKKLFDTIRLTGLVLALYFATPWICSKVVSQEQQTVEPQITSESNDATFQTNEKIINVAMLKTSR